MNGKTVRLNVRCCCTPRAILGTLQVPAYLATRPGFIPLPLIYHQTSIAQGLQRALEHGLKGPPPLPSPERLTAKVMWYQKWDQNSSKGPGARELAVYSDDRPLEFWKQFPTFEEAKEDQMRNSSVGVASMHGGRET